MGVIFFREQSSMFDNGTSKLKNAMLVALIGAVFGALVTIVGQPYVNQLFEQAKTPKIIKEIHRTNIENLPSHVKDQITLITTRYIIRHIAGGVAKDITINIKSSEDISISNLIINPSSEKYKLNQVNEKIKKIEIPAIRPNGIVSFEITHSPNNHLDIFEIAGIGQIVDSSFEENSSSSEWWRYILVSLFLMFLIYLFYILWLFLSRSAKYFVSIESTIGIEDNNKKKIASILVGIVFFNFISTMDLGIIDLPYIPIRDIFYALLIYVLFTNYGELKAALKKALL